MISTGGSTTARLRNGALLQTFSSALPNGSYAAGSRAQGPTVLDCILQEDGQVFWVVDAIAWNGFVLADCNAEFRLFFWVQSKLNELQDLPGSAPFRALPFAACTAGGTLCQSAMHDTHFSHLLSCVCSSSSSSSLSFACSDGACSISIAMMAFSRQPVIFDMMRICMPAYVTHARLAVRLCSTLMDWPCTDGLRAAHSAPVPFIRDGCYLIHKQALYEPGATPLALLWKDADCSRYLLDTDADGLVPEQQQIILQWQADGNVCTQDDPPVVLGRMPDSFAQNVGPKLR